MSHEASRRKFLKTAAVGGAAVLSGPALAAPAAQAQPETLVATLFKSLTDAQKPVVAFPFDHPLRSKVDNNWKITKPIAEVFDKDQTAMIREIFLGVHSPDYAKRVYEATVHDAGDKGFEKGCSVALFGAPGG